ncbi:uncharacterized protein LOC141619629 [Silene latifolia]|uniref:uncharacterized protein LOC141619629 n=1 Tax=Silene latifolia TaxID=37657 RepID=UPI003D77D2B5
MPMLPPLMEQEASSSSELQQCRTVIDDFSGSLSEIRSHCFSVVSLAQQWRTLQSSFSLAHDEVERKEIELRKRFEAVELREREVSDRFEAVELEKRETEIEERFAEVAVKEREIEERFVEVAVKEREIEERFVEVKLKEREFGERFEGLELREKEIEKRFEVVELKAREIEEEFKVLESKKNEMVERSVMVGLKERKIDKRFEVLESREKEIEVRFVVVESKEKEFDERFEFLEKKIEERIKAVESKEREIEESCRKLELKERQVNWGLQDLELKKKQIDECRELWEREVKEDQPAPKFGEAQVKMWCTEMNLKQKQLEGFLLEIASRESDLSKRSREIDLKEKLVEEHCMGEELRERETDERCQEIELEKSRIKEEVIDLERRESEVAERLREAELKEKKIDGLNKETELKNKAINEKRREIIFEENRISRIRMEMERRKRELELKDKKLNDDCESLKFKEREIDERMKEVNVGYEKLEVEKQLVRDYNDQIHLVDKLVKEKGVELDLKEKELRKSLQGVQLREMQNRQQSEALMLRQREIEEKGMSLEVREKEFDKRCQERELREKETVDVPMMEAEGQWKDLRVVVDGETLQLLLNDRVDEHCFMGEAMLKALKSYNDPAALVLSAINGFFPPHLRKGDVVYTTRTVRSSCVLLLELLMNVKPEVCKNVRVKAEEMACLWRQKMQESGERRVVVLGFLLLVVGFRLKGEFERDELKRLWEIIDQHRLAPQLRFELDLFEECEENRAFSQSETDDMNICNEILSACTNMDANRLRSYLNKHVMDHKLFPHKIVDALKLASDPATLVFKVLQGFNLLQSSTIDKTSCIFLLEQLMKLQKHQSVRNPLGKVEQVSSPPLQITQDMRINALAFASRWKRRLTEEGLKPLEVYGFLQFVASYKLASLYDGEELLQLFKVLYDAQPVFWPEENPQLCRALGLTDKIPGLIKSLIKEDRRLQAAKYICTFMEEPHFPLALVLKDHVRFTQQRVEKIQGISNDKNTEKIKVTFELSQLREVLHYIKDYKLEQECSPTALESRMIQLEAAMANLKTVPPVTKMKKDGPKVENPQRLDKESVKNHSCTLVSASDPEVDSNEPTSDCPQQGKRPKVESLRLPSQSNISFKIPSVKTPSLPEIPRAMLPRKLVQPCPVKPTSQAIESQHPARSTNTPGAVYSVAVAPYGENDPQNTL